MSYDLYQVTERVYQVRGYDLSNILFIKSDTGCIVFDSLFTPAKSKAVVYSHAHADHFGGVKQW